MNKDIEKWLDEMHRKGFIFIKLDDRIIPTTQEELERVAISIRPYITKFSDVPRLLAEHKYLFSNCDPIWKSVENVATK